MASLTRDDVQHVAYLARLGLTAVGRAARGTGRSTREIGFATPA